MGQQSGFMTLVKWGLFVLAVVACAQYVLLTVQISSAQTNFKTLGPQLQMDGEKKFRQTLVEALSLDHFDVSPKDISIEIKKTGTAVIRLVASREAKILIFPVRKEVEFYAEPLYDSGL